MNLTEDNRIAVLLNRLDFHTREIQRREENETRLLEWSTALLLAVFAVTLALASSATQLPRPFLTKLIATALVTFPTIVFARRILGERESMARQATIVQRIEEQLNLFEADYFFPGPPLYPERWHGNLAEFIRARKTPIYFTAVTLFMLLAIIATIWTVL